MMIVARVCAQGVTNHRRCLFKGVYDQSSPFDRMNAPGSGPVASSHDHLVQTQVMLPQTTIFEDGTKGRACRYLAGVRIPNRALTPSRGTSNIHAGVSGMWPDLLFRLRKSSFGGAYVRHCGEQKGSHVHHSAAHGARVAPTAKVHLHNRLKTMVRNTTWSVQRRFRRCKRLCTPFSKPTVGR